MKTETEVSKVTNPFEKLRAHFGMSEIRFDCLVRIFDSTNTRTPQWFKSETKFTLEFLQSSDPHTIGLQIKDALSKLEENISQYERSLR